MFAECGKKGTWKYNNRIDSCKMNNPYKPKPPSNSGGSCNQNKTPHVDGKFSLFKTYFTKLFQVVIGNAKRDTVH